MSTTNLLQNRKENAQRFNEYVQSEFDFFEKYYSSKIYEVEVENEKLGPLMGTQVFSPVVQLLTDYRKKFDQSFTSWNKQIEDFGEIYFNNDEDRINLSMCSSKYTNDDHDDLTPFGSSMVEFGELLGHHQIGVLDALESQLLIPPQEGSPLNRQSTEAIENLIVSQILLIKLYNRFIDFCTGISENIAADTFLKKDWKLCPLIQYSDSNTGAWAADREIPTILHLNRTMATSKAEKVFAFSAITHELGHDISDTFKDDLLVLALQKVLCGSVIDPDGKLLSTEALEKLGTTSEKRLELRNQQIWYSWMHELVADAFGIGMLNSESLDGLKNVLRKKLKENLEPLDLILGNFNWDKDLIPYEEHPNSFLRILISIEFIDQLHHKSDDGWKKEAVNSWRAEFENTAPVVDLDDDLEVHLKDELNRDNPELQTFKVKLSEIKAVVATMLKTEFLPGQTLRNLIDHVRQDDEVIALLKNFKTLFK